MSKRKHGTLYKLTGVVLPMNCANVDTDQLTPKQFLKWVEGTRLGKFLLFDWRHNAVYV